jgi:oxygen-independent coproporphyrinogen III oxidase
MRASSQEEIESNRFGLYLHVPFCVHKCSYCDFYSFTDYQNEMFSSFVDHLTQDIRQTAEWLHSVHGKIPKASTVFLGGGTPSLLPPELLARLLASLSPFSFASEVEITMEANPETLSESYLQKLKELTPINRISLGAQSFQPKYLSALERLASPEAIVRAAKLLKSCGYENFNLDFIFAIPGQTEEELCEDLKRAVDLGPQHLSSYHLSLKPAHPLYAALPNSDRAADLYESVLNFMDANSFYQYEISNFSRPEKACLHNLLYWEGGDFLGIGPSAASRFFWEGRFHHRKQPSDLKMYENWVTAGEAPQFDKTSHSQTVLEATFLELRCNAGVDLDLFARRYEYQLENAKRFPLFLEKGLIQKDGRRLKLTERGRLLADSVTSELVDI